MVNEKTEKVVKKSVGKAKGSAKKGTVKTTTKKKSSDQKKKGSVKKTTLKKTATKPAEKKKTVKRSVKKHSGDVVTKANVDIGIKKASKSELKKVDNVINNLSGRSVQTNTAQSFITTVPGVFRRVPATRKAVSSVHKATPIQGIMNYLKKMF